MTKSSRLFIVFLLIGVGFYSLFPSIRYYFFVEPDIRWLIENANQLGQVTSSATVETEDVTTTLPEEVKAAVGATTEGVEDAPSLEVGGTLAERLADPAVKLAYDEAKELRKRSIKPGLDLSGGLSIDVEADFTRMSEVNSEALIDFDEVTKQEAVDRIVTKIQNRIDAAGVSDITIRKQPNYRLTIQIPGETSSERIHSLVATTGRLEFKFVDEQKTSIYSYDETSGEENPVYDDPTRDLAFLYEINVATGKRERTNPLILEKEVLLTGDAITDARLSYNEYGEAIVSFSLNTAGATKFSQITSQNTGRRLAIILDGHVMSAPGLNVHIPDGQGQISGGFTIDAARDLALILRSGSLPVPIRIISEDIIAPKLGADLKGQAFSALFISLISIAVFMLLYYRLSGLIAVLALLLNAILIVSFLASFGLSLSIAGIAGLLLTIGMSVDANVIIFSRIREELKDKNNTLAIAIRKGYARAFWTIFDANVTTLIAAFMLFYYGTGFLQGFATTLFVGILVSMFTALFVTRLIFDFLIDYGWFKRYSPIVI